MRNNANTNTYRKSYNLKYNLRLIHVDMTEFESFQNCESLRISVIRELKNLQCLAVLTNLCRGNLIGINCTALNKSELSNFMACTIIILHQIRNTTTTTNHYCY